MNLRRLLNLALAVFVTVGLAVAPLVAPSRLVELILLDTMGKSPRAVVFLGDS